MEGRRAIASLFEAAQRERTVTLGDTLGQGGMGVVHLAEQVALGRTVAVKRLRGGLHGDAHVLALMREAWVTGSLEHPNIVPVHDVGIDPDGSPFLVMKRIEGEHWGTLIADPDAVRARFGVQDVAAWHVGVLIQVCNAMAFAHDRDVIHRDLKPENVMIGEFGEVYVLDWGIALSLVDDGSGRLPLATRSRTVAGTPAYMAPEMLRGGPLGPLTDVYLLGGLLYEILTGRPPHAGRTLELLAAQIEASRPAAPEGPSELVALCLTALDADPSRRPQSAAAMRQDLQQHLEHNGAIRLAEVAAESHERLREELARPSPDPDLVWHLFGEARFGFRQALRAWPAHPQAGELLSQAVVTMVARELEAGDTQGAARLLAEDPVDDPELIERVQQAVVVARRAAVLANPVAGQRTRWGVAVTLGAIWTTFSAGLYWYQPTPGLAGYLGADAAFVITVLVIGLWARESLFHTSLNRRTWATALMVPVAQAILVMGVNNLGYPLVVVDQFQLFFWAAIAAMAALSIDGRFVATALAYTLGWVGASLYPEHALGFSALGNGVLTVVVAVIWRPGPDYVRLDERTITSP